MAPADARIKVAEYELLDGPASLDGFGGYRHARFLIRRGGRPVRWLALEHDGTDRFPRDRLVSALAASSAPGGGDLASAASADPVPCPRSAPAMTVVVPTRGRPAMLPGCIDAILATRYPSLEVVVVDSAPADDETARSVAGLPVRYVREPLPGVARARNRGLAMAGGEIVAFTDDDARPDRWWLHAMAGRFEDPDVAVVTGLVAPAELETRAQRLFELACGGLGRGLEPRVFRRSEMGPRLRVQIQAVGTGANMAFRRTVLESLGGFEPSLGAGTAARGGEDLEMFHRVVEAGHTVCYEPGAIVWHVHRREMPALRAQIEDTGHAFGAYLRYIARSSSMGRATVLAYGLVPWVAWLLGRFAKRAVGRNPRPFALLWAELSGALAGRGRA